MGGKYDLQVDGNGGFRRILCCAKDFSLFAGGVLEGWPGETQGAGRVLAAIPPMRSEDGAAAVFDEFASLGAGPVAFDSKRRMFG
jgi:hypothetical protein